ncbi:hypothetical protein ACTOB_001236 [Actinoplanes oblitus]|uniref:Uncharacterized protein n=1 Tax=Actinoplanes oblitus TaxID=3040509 RepID=A0ABY8WJ76_9ACTN|nr:hypothetical protein [Actinoplanes oblitus]WIM97688.1 hypothetical protein ACTOB_001236 [Actinoplanes oblitus]
MTRLMIARPTVETLPAPRLLTKTKRPDLPTLPGTSWHNDVAALRAWIIAVKADPDVDPYWVDQITQPIKEQLAAARRVSPVRGCGGRTPEHRQIKESNR